MFPDRLTLLSSQLAWREAKFGGKSQIPKGPTQPPNILALKKVKFVIDIFPEKSKCLET